MISTLEGGSTTTAGGTAKDYSRTGKRVTNGVALSEMAEPDFFAREELVATVRMPQQKSDGSWTKQKNSIQLVIPGIDDLGNVVYNVARIEVEVHPDAASTVLAQLREEGAQLIKHASLDTFFSAGNIDL